MTILSALFLYQILRPIESILFPLGYGEGCWSSVILQNVSEQEANVWLTAHKSSGALAPLTGAANSRMRIPPGAKISLRLEVDGEDDRQAWVQMKERGAQAIALSGAVECTGKGEVRTIAANVIFPSRDPWIRGDVADFHANEIWMLNASPAPASAALCYSSGAYSQLSDNQKPTEICADEADLFIPPFGMRIVPIVKNGNSRFSLRSAGEAIAIRLLVPTAERKKKFAVDSTIQFADIPPSIIAK